MAILIFPIFLLYLFLFVPISGTRIHQTHDCTQSLSVSNCNPDSRDKILHFPCHWAKNKHVFICQKKQWPWGILLHKRLVLEQQMETFPWLRYLEMGNPSTIGGPWQEGLSHSPLHNRRVRQNFVPRGHQLCKGDAGIRGIRQIPPGRSIPSMHCHLLNELLCKFPTQDINKAHVLKR